MTFFHSFAPSIALLLFGTLCHAVFDTASRGNVALYWGQGPSQQRLLHFCQQSTIDIIPIGFVNIFPAQGNGFPGTNFGNQCWGPPYVYAGPGNNPSLNQLQSQCPQINADIPVCQATYGKKIILSLGGATSGYQLTGAANGVAFADFLWGAFGPRTAAWLASGLPRPFDGADGKAVEVDGFDFDIEHASTDNAAGYIAMIARLRSKFALATKKYIITGAPQCVVPDASMGTMIAKAQFDILFVQYYNTPQCSARNWVIANPNYGTTGVELASGFSYNKWVAFLVGTASANAKLYIGVPGSTLAVATGTNYLTPVEISNLLKAYYCKPNFGGVMIWEATYAENNAAYYSKIKNILAGYATNKALPCYKAPTSTSSQRTSTTSKSKTSSKTTMTTSTKKTSTSSKITSTSTKKSSTSSKQTSTSTKKTSTSSKKSSTSTKKTSTTSAKKTSTSSKPTSTSTKKSSSSSKLLTTTTTKKSSTSLKPTSTSTKK